MSADRYAWMDAALCAQADPDTGPGYATRQPKRICGHCPVRRDCEAHARRLEADGAMAGVWGGASQQQRRIARRRSQNHETARHPDTLKEA